MPGKIHISKPGSTQASDGTCTPRGFVISVLTGPGMIAGVTGVWFFVVSLYYCISYCQTDTSAFKRQLHCRGPCCIKSVKSMMDAYEHILQLDGRIVVLSPMGEENDKIREKT